MVVPERVVSAAKFGYRAVVAAYIRSLEFRSLEFLVRCPPEIAWHCLGYWRCQYPADTQFIEDLGVH